MSIAKRESDAAYDVVNIIRKKREKENNLYEEIACFYFNAVSVVVGQC